MISHLYIIHIWRDQTSYHNNTIIRGNITHLTMLCHGNLRHLVNKTVFRILTFNWFVYRFPCLYRCTNRGDTTNPLYNTRTLRVHLGTLVPNRGIKPNHPITFLLFTDGIIIIHYIIIFNSN